MLLFLLLALSPSVALAQNFCCCILEPSQYPGSRVCFPTSTEICFEPDLNIGFGSFCEGPEYPAPTSGAPTVAVAPSPAPTTVAPTGVPTSGETCCCDIGEATCLRMSVTICTHPDLAIGFASQCVEATTTTRAPTTPAPTTLAPTLAPTLTGVDVPFCCCRYATNAQGDQGCAVTSVDDCLHGLGSECFGNSFLEDPVGVPALTPYCCCAVDPADPTGACISTRESVCLDTSDVGLGSSCQGSLFIPTSPAEPSVPAVIIDPDQPWCCCALDSNNPGDGCFNTQVNVCLDQSSDGIGSICAGGTFFPELCCCLTDPSGPDDGACIDGILEQVCVSTSIAGLSSRCSAGTTTTSTTTTTLAPTTATTTTTTLAPTTTTASPTTASPTTAAPTTTTASPTTASPTTTGVGPTTTGAPTTTTAAPTTTTASPTTTTASPTTTTASPTTTTASPTTTTTTTTTTATSTTTDRDLPTTTGTTTSSSTATTTAMTFSECCCSTQGEPCKRTISFLCLLGAGVCEEDSPPCCCLLPGSTVCTAFDLGFVCALSGGTCQEPSTTTTIDTTTSTTTTTATTSTTGTTTAAITSTVTLDLMFAEPVTAEQQVTLRNELAAQLGVDPSEVVLSQEGSSVRVAVPETENVAEVLTNVATNGVNGLPAVTGVTIVTTTSTGASTTTTTTTTVSLTSATALPSTVANTTTTTTTASNAVVTGAPTVAPSASSSTRVGAALAFIAFFSLFF